MQADLFPSQAKPLTLRVFETVPSFKNSKLLVSKDRRGRPLSRPLLITKPEYQQAMERITESFVSQLRCAFQTESGEMLTGQSLRSSIAYAVPDDDCWTRIPDQQQHAELCAPGQEGATITIERLN